MTRSTKAVFFDVDFTLIRPGPTFRGEGYRVFCERHGMTVDESAFDSAVESAASLLDGPDDTVYGAPYDAEIFVALHAAHHRADGRPRRERRRMRPRDLR